MPSCSKAKNPRGIEIVFTEEDHSYRSIIDGQEIKYISGTQLLGRYFPPFDPTGEITKRCAQKENVTVEEIKARWAEKGARSCRLGTRLHETIEDILHRRDLRNVPEDAEEERRFKNGIAVAQKLLQKIDILGIEDIVFSDRLRIAGTIDLLAQSRKDGTYYIIDHKTNAAIDKENRYGNVCFSPVRHLPDTAFYHYALQLNLYQYLLKAEKYVSSKAKFKMFLNHVTADVVEMIELPDLQIEVRDIIIDYLLNKDKNSANQVIERL